LEKFFEGLADGTRRGSKTAVKCLIKCCQPRDPPPEPSPDHTVPSNNDFAYGTSGIAYNNNNNNNNSQSTDSTTKTYIKPMEFVTLGYRIALAAAFLKATTTSTASCDDDDDQDVSRFLPPPAGDETSAPGLIALAHSLAEVAVKRQQRLQYHASIPTDDESSMYEYLSQIVVEEDDVYEWAEQVGPMYGSILPTFLHLIFFPNKPTPPSRTSFDYPTILQESAIFNNGQGGGNSTFLFSFGCMSAALGGEVRRVSCLIH
jgi:hypothetical protein